MEKTLWTLYSIFLCLNALRSRSFDRSFLTSRLTPATSNSAIYIFCATLGELNACRLLINRVYSKRSVVFLVDRPDYVDAFKKHYPKSQIIRIDSGLSDLKRSMQNLWPEKLILCEIPLLPNDAPCRFSYPVLRLFRKNKVACYAINGWLYEEPPSCLQDRLERFLFTGFYLQSFNAIAVQTDDVLRKLIAISASIKDRIQVTGNMKFDNALAQDLSDNADFFSSGQRWLLTAGCVKSREQYTLLVDVFAKIKECHTDSAMVIAPRHPDKKEQISLLTELLDKKGLSYQRRTIAEYKSLQLSTDVLILETYGELEYFYKKADACYVGINHNILEPLRYNKCVFVKKGWQKSYPSYPIYKLLKDQGVINVFESADQFEEALIRLRGSEPFINKKQVLQEFSGASDRNYNLIFSNNNE